MKIGTKVIVTGTIMGISEDGHANINLDGGVMVGLPLANLQSANDSVKERKTTNKQTTNKKK